MVWHMLALHPFSSLHMMYTIPCSIIFYHTSIGIRSDHMAYSTSSYSQLLSDLLYGYWKYLILLQFFARTVVALSVSFIKHLRVISTPSFLDITILGQRIAFVVIQIYVVCYVLWSPLHSMRQLIIGLCQLELLSRANPHLQLIALVILYVL